MTGVAKYKGEVLFDLTHQTEPGEGWETAQTERCLRRARTLPLAAAAAPPPAAPAAPAASPNAAHTHRSRNPPFSTKQQTGAKLSDAVVEMKGKLMAGMSAYIAAHNLRGDDADLMEEEGEGEDGGGDGEDASGKKAKQQQQQQQQHRGHKRKQPQ